MTIPDEEFNSLRDALASERESAARLGAVWVAIDERRNDDRIDGLLLSLLQDRDLSFSASLAALCWADPILRHEYSQGLERAWAINRSGYRRALLESIEDQALPHLAERYSRESDVELRVLLAERLSGIESDDAGDGLLLLTHDDVAEVVLAALAGIHHLGDSVKQAVLSRLLSDTRPPLLSRVIPLALKHLDLDEVEGKLRSLESSQDIDLRLVASQGIEELRAKRNLADAEILLAGLEKAVASDHRSEAARLSEEITKLIPRHPMVEYQLARLAARDGDARRALVTLHHLCQLGSEWHQRALKEEDFFSLHAIEAWQHLGH